MKQVQGSDEELVSVLLLVPGQVVGVGPDHVEQLVWREGVPVGAEKLLEELRDLTDDTGVLLGGLTHVSVREEVVPE